MLKEYVLKEYKLQLTVVPKMAFIEIIPDTFTSYPNYKEVIDKINQYIVSASFKETGVESKLTIGSLQILTTVETYYERKQGDNFEVIKSYLAILDILRAFLPGSL